jgi:hypothetical protein
MSFWRDGLIPNKEERGEGKERKEAKLSTFSTSTDRHTE